MKISKFIYLEILLLCGMILCSTVAMKVMEMLFNSNYQNFFESSFLVEFSSRLMLLVITLLIVIKKKGVKGNVN